jgi:hypothetical protein
MSSCGQAAGPRSYPSSRQRSVRKTPVPCFLFVSIVVSYVLSSALLHAAGGAARLQSHDVECRLTWNSHSYLCATLQYCRHVLCVLSRRPARLYRLLALLCPCTPVCPRSSMAVQPAKLSTATCKPQTANSTDRWIEDCSQILGDTTRNVIWVDWSV